MVILSTDRRIRAVAVARGSHISGGVLRAVAQQAEPHYRQAPSVYYNQRRPVLPPEQVAELVHEVASVPATAAQIAQVIELLRDIRDEASAKATPKIARIDDTYGVACPDSYSNCQCSQQHRYRQWCNDGRHYYL
jgi:hypothetical protein